MSTFGGKNNLTYHDKVEKFIPVYLMASNLDVLSNYCREKIIK